MAAGSGWSTTSTPNRASGSWVSARSPCRPSSTGAPTQGCFGVDSLALPGDRHTKNFFESFGLVARAIIVHRSLS